MEDYSLGNLDKINPNAFAQFYNSPFVFWIKVIIGIYLIVLFVNIIMLLCLRDVSANLRVGLRGMNIPVVRKGKMRKRWDYIKGLSESGNASQYKFAIIEADAIADEILAGIGYKGANMAEKLQQIGKAHLDDHLEALKSVHKIRNRIVHEENFEVDERLVKTVIGVYENFLKYLEFLD